MSERPWDVRVMSPVRRQLDRLPISVAAAASNPRRLGKPLRFALEGYWSARRGPYGIVYSIDGETRTVSVVAVAHRAGVYRPQ